MTLASGTRIGSYEILSAIGAGGMGEVYRGWLDDGRILSSAWPLRSALWRFHPATSADR